MKLRKSFKHVFRIGTVFVPSTLAWTVSIYAPHRDDVTRAIARLLQPFWFVPLIALAIRIAMIVGERRRVKAANGEPPRVGERTSLLEQIDVLTSPGSSLAWLSSFALMGAVGLGWASLAIVGMLGIGLFDIVVLYAFVVFSRGDFLFKKGGSIVRKLTPNQVTEGDEVIEELTFSNVHIPIGTRLFVTGRLGPRWATTRHVLETTESEGEVVIETEVGPAIRGTHQAELLEAWLQDSFGLCRSMAMYVAPARLTVLPRLRPVVEKVTPLVDHGIGAREAKQAKILPTEGCFDVREYKPGDDVRRIHWVRSLFARQLIVRMPDESPPDRPRVKLVLDTYFPEVFALGGTDVPADMLDALVVVWLGVANALAEAGVRVTLVSAIVSRDAQGNPTILPSRHEISRRNPSAALQLGARVEWQGQVQASDLLTNEATFVVSRGVQVVPPNNQKIHWIVVPTPPVSEPAWPKSGALTPFPMGHPENKYSHHRHEVETVVRARKEQVKAMLAMQQNVAMPPPGSFVAISSMNGIRLQAIT